MSKAAKSVIVPWKNPCKLRHEIRDRELGEADFAVDLNKVIFGVPGGRCPFTAIRCSFSRRVTPRQTCAISAVQCSGGSRARKAVRRSST
jgi:hypothetical protein